MTSVAGSFETYRDMATEAVNPDPPVRRPLPGTDYDVPAFVPVRKPGEMAPDSASMDQKLILPVAQEMSQLLTQL